MSLSTKHMPLSFQNVLLQAFLRSKKLTRMLVSCPLTMRRTFFEDTCRQQSECITTPS
uniref:Uncharacterized protein n=1 Tax=Anguilla anguilla TaxID=7936 RepID=A0A0E9WHJ6_ANGAN